MPIAAHRAIAEQIMRTLNRAGYWSRKQLEKNDRIKVRRHHGFDMGKLTPSSLFYLPCQAANPAHSFFIDLNGPDRLSIDPYMWAGYAANHQRPPVEPTKTVEPVASQSERPPIPPTKCPKLRRMRELIADEVASKAESIRARREEAVIDRWRAALPREGNDAFFRLGQQLARIGISHGEINSILWQEAGHARHPSERRAQIKYVMRNLRAPPCRMAA
jgi:hypothetical protein